jgi:hypothetical protein
MNGDSNKRTCKWCNEPIKGRIDKSFCDDSCRNAFNNQRNIGEYNIVRNINHALIRNRRILVDLLSDAHPFVKVSREQLLLLGFQFKYCTHYFSTPNGSICYFCYDYGYQPIEHDWFLLIRKKNSFLPDTDNP